MSRLALQIVNALIAAATVVLGGMQLVLGVRSPLYSEAVLPAFPVLDSNLRFFGGMGLALGLTMLWILPSIEKYPRVFRVFWLTAFVGGIGRLLSAWQVGSPSQLLLGFTVLEVIGAPLVVYWHHTISRS